MDQELNQDNIWENTRRMIIRRESWRYYWTFFLTGVVLGGFAAYFYYAKFFIFMCVTIAGLVFWAMHFCLRMWWILSNSCVINENMLTVRKGIVFRDISKVDIVEITEMRVLQSNKEKALGVGSIEIHTKDQKPACVAYGILNPEDIKEHIVKVQTALAKKRLPFMNT
ncbi:PH domain-containing protein [Candidatus Uabimicrobium amorphum]|uniref:YdbS-like PH domain-containing protein n=1 Tax=Uabimicrobium amorphum TaxID=2596890 RepID=A0A5S9IPF0_UABAM|nr:PH domain-containing protein [Candidatus Uabimicrobium amorphum]BBM85663.1 hypothetical protein UABAM_04037 [Candidatus Uabimicrobium amorphum]